MKTFRLYPLFILMGLSAGFNSCKKGKASCYDEALYQKCKDQVCTMDCPGVTGCDGKTYCNECEANRQGIRKK